MGTHSAKVVWEKELSSGGREGVGGRGNFKVRTSLFGSFQKAEYRHEVEKFHPHHHQTKAGLLFHPPHTPAPPPHSPEVAQVALAGGESGQTGEDVF